MRKWVVRMSYLILSALLFWLVLVGNKTYDGFDRLLITKYANLIEIESDIAIIDIDDFTLSEWGGWPPSREKLAHVVQSLYDRGAVYITTTIFMPDARENDELLSQKLSRNTILPSVAINSFGDSSPDTSDSFPSWTTIISPNEKYSDHKNAPVNLIQESDGTVFSIPGIIEIDGNIEFSLPLMVALNATSDAPPVIKKTSVGYSVNDIRVSGNGSVLFKNHYVKTFSANKIPPTVPSIIVIGSSATGISQPINTVESSHYPHSLLAMSIGTFIDNSMPIIPNWNKNFSSFALLLVIIIISFTKSKSLIGIVILLTAVTTTIPFFTMSYGVVVSNLAIYIAIAFSLIIRYLEEWHKEKVSRARISDQFGRYVSKEVVNEIQKNPNLLFLGGEKRILSVVFTDLRDFTTLGEHYGDNVEEFTNFINSYMTAITSPLLSHNGCLLKFVGDATLHVHGAPLPTPPDTNTAIEATGAVFSMFSALDRFNEKNALCGLKTVHMGAAITTGPTLIGNIGAADRYSYDVLGDTVSLCARLESLTKNYRVDVLISDQTALDVGGAFCCLEVEVVKVKGKLKPEKIWTCIQWSDDRTAEYQQKEIHSRLFNQWCSGYDISDLLKEYNVYDWWNGKLNGVYSIWASKINLP
jgi:adenylate cyclase